MILNSSQRIRKTSKFDEIDEIDEKDQIELMTPYIKRSLNHKLDHNLIHIELIIDEWLLDKNIRLITPENMQYENRMKLTSLTATTLNDSSININSVDSSNPEKTRLSLMDNNLFMRRKISNLKDAETVN